jgi:hypothetical protein
MVLPPLRFPSHRPKRLHKSTRQSLGTTGNRDYNFERAAEKQALRDEDAVGLPEL